MVNLDKVSARLCNTCVQVTNHIQDSTNFHCLKCRAKRKSERTNKLLKRDYHRKKRLEKKKELREKKKQEAEK